MNHRQFLAEIKQFFTRAPLRDKVLSVTATIGALVAFVGMVFMLAPTHDGIVSVIINDALIVVLMGGSGCVLVCIAYDAIEPPDPNSTNAG
ncbi:MAG TPA: hypothetical protein VLF69_02010 [Candidatus Saccharimonadales bacterium]|nr:hypothetical protein [Candidatus Saccharimonadales bacterium]